MGVISLRLPDDVQATIAAVAGCAGVSVEEYLLRIVGDQAEAERAFWERAGRAVPGRAEVILARAGIGNPPEPGDEIPPDLVDRWGPNGTAWKE